MVTDMIHVLDAYLYNVEYAFNYVRVQNCTAL